MKEGNADMTFTGPRTREEVDRRDGPATRSFDDVEPARRSRGPRAPAAGHGLCVGNNAGYQAVIDVANDLTLTLDGYSAGARAEINVANDLTLTLDGSDAGKDAVVTVGGDLELICVTPCGSLDVDMTGGGTCTCTTGGGGGSCPGTGPCAL